VKTEPDISREALTHAVTNVDTSAVKDEPIQESITNDIDPIISIMDEDVDIDI
jgi:hypothetical protein